MQMEFNTLVSIASGLVAIYGLWKIAKTPLDDVKKNKDDIKTLKEKADRHAEIDKAILNGLDYQ